MTIKTVEQALPIWHQLNNDGHGSSVGEEGDTPLEAAEREGYTTIDWHEDGTCLVRDNAGQSLLIGDANGPWAIVVEG